MKYFLLVCCFFCLTGGLFAGEDIFSVPVYQAYCESAEKYMAAKKYRKAEKIYRMLEKQARTRALKAEFLEKQADCLLLRKKTSDALELYKRLIRDYPLHTAYDRVVPQLRRIAECYVNGDGTFLGLRDRELAISVYETILIETPSIHMSIRDRMRLAELQILENRKDEAVSTYQEILQLDADQDDIRFELAKLLFALSRRGDGDGARVRAAERYAQTILERNPGYPRKAEVEKFLMETRELTAQRLLDLAKFYLGSAQNRPVAAKNYLAELTNAFPGTKAAKEGQKILARLLDREQNALRKKVLPSVQEK